jgi:hypothetical protein
VRAVVYHTVGWQMVVWIVVWIVPSVDGRDVLTFDVTGEPCEFKLMVSLRDDARGGLHG